MRRPCLALFEEPENNAVDIVLVFDRSGSVFGNRCNEAEQEFIKQLPGYVKGRMAMNGGKLFGKPSVHIATFGCHARMETTEPIDVTREDADEQVTAVTKKFINMGGTNISDGIACAANKLATLECSDPNSARSGVIVVLTDGQAGAGATSPRLRTTSATCSSRTELVALDAGLLWRLREPRLPDGGGERGPQLLLSAPRTRRSSRPPLEPSSRPWSTRPAPTWLRFATRPAATRWSRPCLWHSRQGQAVRAGAARRVPRLHQAGRKPALSFPLPILVGGVVEKRQVTVAVEFAPMSEVPPGEEQVAEVFKRADAQREVKEKLSQRMDELVSSSNGDVRKIADGVQAFKIEAQASGTPDALLRGVDAVYRSLSARADAPPPPTRAAPSNFGCGVGGNPTYRSLSVAAGGDDDAVYRSASAVDDDEDGGIVPAPGRRARTPWPTPTSWSAPASRRPFRRRRRRRRSKSGVKRRVTKARLVTTITITTHPQRDQPGRQHDAEERQQHGGARPRCRACCPAPTPRARAAAGSARAAPGPTTTAVTTSGTAVSCAGVAAVRME